MTDRPHANRASGWCESTNLVLLHTRDFSQCPSCDEHETSCDKIAAKIIDLANCTKFIHHALGQANLISFWFTSRQVRRAGRSYLSGTASSSLLRRTQCELPSESRRSQQTTVHEICTRYGQIQDEASALAN